MCKYKLHVCTYPTVRFTLRFVNLFVKVSRVCGTAHQIWLKATKEFCNSVKLRQFSPFEQTCIRIWDVLKLSKNLILAFKAVGRNKNLLLFSNSIRMHFFNCFFFYLFHRIQQPIASRKFSPFCFFKVSCLIWSLDKAIFGITL